jgi:hypothetical protein
MAMSKQDVADRLLQRLGDILPIDGASIIEYEGSDHGTIGIELADGGQFFIEIKDV